MPKIIVGTANFVNNYGLNNFKYKSEELKKILFFLKKKKINFFDVSFSYGFNKSFLKKINFKKTKIILKIKLPSSKVPFFLNRLEKKIIDYLDYFKVKKYEVIMLHNSNDLTTFYSEKLVKILNSLKKKKITKKIGVSIYDPRELNLIFKKLKPQILQAPLNIFDQRILNNNYLNKIKKEKIQIQARSIFLQGIIFKSNRYIKNKFKNKKINKIFKNFEETCKFQNITKLEYAIDFIKKQKKIDFVTLGFDSVDQLKKILFFFEKKSYVKQKKFTTTNSEFIYPRKWKI